MPYVGKSGSDALFKALAHICRIERTWHLKLLAAIDQAVTDGKITDLQRSIAHTFLESVSVACDIFELIAGNSGL